MGTDLRSANTTITDLVLDKDESAVLPRVVTLIVDGHNLLHQISIVETWIRNVDIDH